MFWNKTYHKKIREKVIGCTTRNREKIVGRYTKRKESSYMDKGTKVENIPRWFRRGCGQAVLVLKNKRVASEILWVKSWQRMIKVIVGLVSSSAESLWQCMVSTVLIYESNSSGCSSCKKHQYKKITSKRTCKTWESQEHTQEQKRH